MAATKFMQISPGRILLLSFLFVISAGAFLLSLPISRVVDISLIDILFTSASSTCVTGLKVVPIYYFTTFGKCVILTLIQIGGLGLMTLSFFLISLVLNLRLVTKFVAGQMLDFEYSGKIKTFLKLIIGFTFFSELLGAIALYFSFKQFMDPQKAVFYSIFHSISSFCNAGASLFEEGMSVLTYRPFSLMTISILVFFGGIGFIVWYELSNNIITWIKNWRKGEYKKITISLHTKITVIMSSSLIVGGAILFWILERSNTLRELNFTYQIVNSIFMSTMTRTTGFSSLPIDTMILPTLLVVIVLMFIGASPNSTGGGVKVTTFTLFIATIVAIVKNKESVELFGRRIPADQIFKTTVIMALALIWIVFTTFVLLITDSGFSFLQIFFESVSAFSTVGLSTGITPHLSNTAKILLLFSMFLGRVGTLTLVLALRRKEEPQFYSYPEERVILG